MGQWHLLRTHLQSVASLARGFAAETPWEADAERAGLLHDLGKYAERFQARLRGQDQGLDHWSQGAWIALTKWHAPSAALAIEGHHIGLQVRIDRSRSAGLDPLRLSLNHPLGLALSSADTELLFRRLCNESPAPDCSFSAPPRPDDSAAQMLDARLLFSCLVDADFLDTEAHFLADANGKRYRKLAPELEPERALEALEAYCTQRFGNVHYGSNANPVQRQRQYLLDHCISAAGQPVGLFTLTAPTGTGKTLAMLRFALLHAVRHRLRRIVLAVPYLSILDQTAAIYREIFAQFGSAYVLEHHSLAGLDNQPTRGDDQNAAESSERARRLLAENWDAPIILTSNVQLLESLHHHSPAACRKLHRLTRSVILCDEVQTLPQALAVPTLATLSQLASGYGTSIVFATATQPAFEHLDPNVRRLSKRGWSATEINLTAPAMFAALNRIECHWPDGATHFEQLAASLLEHPQAMVIVNLKRHAQALLELLANDKAALHLSTQLCPRHRMAVLAEVRRRLHSGEPCRLIATQCIEAGVDVDFPNVYRAMAPLDALAQAAGRCNREGKRALGNFHVFKPEDAGYPTPAYRQAAALTEMMLKANGALNLSDPALYQDYYRRLYELAATGSANPLLREAIERGDFPTVAKLYRLIDAATVQVLVPYDDATGQADSLRDEVLAHGFDGRWLRHAQPYSVAIYRQLTHPAWRYLIPLQPKLTKKKHVNTDEPDSSYFALAQSGPINYHPRLGLQFSTDQSLLIA